MKRFFTIQARLTPGAMLHPEAPDAIVAHIQAACRARGIAGERIADLPTASSLQFAFVVIGERPEGSGWDADGAPTEEWPAQSAPWGGGAPVGGAA